MRTKTSLMQTKLSVEINAIRKNNQNVNQQTVEIARKTTTNKTKAQILKAERKKVAKNRKRCQWMNKVNHHHNLKIMMTAKIQTALWKLMIKKDQDPGLIRILTQTRDRKEQRLPTEGKSLWRKAKRIWIRRTMIDCLFVYRWQVLYDSCYI